MKKMLSWWAEILLVGGLLYTEHYALAAVALYVAIGLYGLRANLDRLRAIVRVFQAFNEPKLAALIETVPQETLDRLVRATAEHDPDGWESLKADAARLGLTLCTPEELRAHRAEEARQD